MVSHFYPNIKAFCLKVSLSVFIKVSVSDSGFSFYSNIHHMKKPLFVISYGLI